MSPEPVREGISDEGDSTSLREDRLLTSDATSGVARDEDAGCDADGDGATLASASLVLWFTNVFEVSSRAKGAGASVCRDELGSTGAAATEGDGFGESTGLRSGVV